MRPSWWIKCVHFSIRMNQQMENAGIGPATSCMRSTRSANWANSPLYKMQQYNNLFHGSNSHIKHKNHEYSGYNTITSKLFTFSSSHIIMKSYTSELNLYFLSCNTNTGENWESTRLEIDENHILLLERFKLIFIYRYIYIYI